mmetsp:Transcript_936/g.2045  ORF Transcript_936/g.2045 Transcript_936/m.2045 type:complete len:542 (+) Transcript_936:42-1667(+)
MGKFATKSGVVLFIGSYVLLYYGLYGALVEYQYTVQPQLAWFDGSPHKSAWDTVFSVIQPPPVPILPRTVRALLGSGDDTDVGLRSPDLGLASALFATSEGVSVEAKASGGVSGGAAAAAGSDQAAASHLRPGGALLHTNLAVDGPQPEAPADASSSSSSSSSSVSTSQAPTFPLGISDKSLVGYLLEEARAGRIGFFAPIALVTFGIVLPLVKLVLVIGFLGTETGVAKPSMHLHIASFLSRWTAVDAVAEAGIVALLLQAGMFAKHDLGYTSFIGYVFLSGFGIWLMLPNSSSSTPAVISQVLPGHRTLAACLFPLSAAVFATLLYFGAVHFAMARMQASISEDAIVKRLDAFLTKEGGDMLEMGKSLLAPGEYEAMLREFAEKVPKLDAELSACKAMLVLIQSRHPHTIVGSVVLYIGIVFMPLMEVLASAFAIKARFALSPRNSLERWQSLLSFVSEFALLEVFVGGLAVCHGIMSSFSVLRMDLMPGFYFLAAAAAIGVFNRFLTNVAMAPSDVEKEEESQYGAFDENLRLSMKAR